MNPTGTARQLTPIYECPHCETRYLNPRRCPDCDLLCRRVGTGGTCPYCDEPVTLTDIATEADQPRVFRTA